MDARTAADLGMVTNLVDVTKVDETISMLDAQGKPAEKYPAKPMNADSKIVEICRLSVMKTWQPFLTETALKVLTLKINWFPDK